MRILLLDTGRGAGPETIATWRDRLDLRPDDEVALLGWNPPREPLPVTTHLVFGPDLRPVPTPPRRVEVAPAVRGAASAPAAAATTSGPTPTPEPAAAPSVEETPAVPVPDPGPDAPPAAAGAQVTEQAQDAPAGPSPAAPVTPVAPATPSAPPASAGAARPGGVSESEGAAQRRARIAGLPVYHPERVRQAARWRATKAKTFGRRAAGRARREVVRRSTITPERRRVLANNAISAQFGLAALASSQTRELFARADLVLPMDTRSQPAAWMLAQRIPGPDVVVGIPAAQRVLAERRG